jgi:hypothetical protein
MKFFVNIEMISLFPDEAGSAPAGLLMNDQAHSIDRDRGAFVYLRPGYSFCTEKIH